MKTIRPRVWLLALLTLCLSTRTQAQWITQTNSLRAGWNAAFLHVDPSPAVINDFVSLGDPIEEIWLWNSDLPPSQALVQPQSPVPGSQWSTWTRTAGRSSELQTLRGNAAILVRVTDGVSAFAWRVKGRPATPTYRWSLSGLNLIGFPAVTAPAAPFFDTFLSHDAQALDWSQGAEIFRYQGGALGPTNPVVVSPLAFRLTPVQREQAYWVRSGTLYNQYFGPFHISGASTAGLRFGDSVSAYRLLLKNVANTAVTVTLTQVASEAAPVGQTNSAGLLPLVIRGPISNTNLTYGYTNVGPAGIAWTLAPSGQVGSEAEVMIGVNRSQLSGAPGTLYASILRFTDSFGLTRVELAASATTPGRTGLWIGNAEVDYVSQYLKPYAKADSQSSFEALLARLQLGQGMNGYRYEWDPVSGRVLVFGGPDNRRGSYLLDGPVKLDAGGVARTYPLRLIVHNGDTGAVLLQRAYIGVGQATSNQVVATREEALMSTQLATARRVSATHLPTSDGNNPWLFTGTMQEGSALSATVTLAHDDQSSNPFLHTYHPDHDNLDAQFEQSLPAGFESYGVRRVISLQFAPPADNFDSLTRSAGSMGGNYSEVLTFVDRNGDTKQFNVLGSFSLKRVTDIATLTQQ